MYTYSCMYLRTYVRTYILYIDITCPVYRVYRIIYTYMENVMVINWNWCFMVFSRNFEANQRSLQRFPVAGVPAFFASVGLSASFFSSSLSLSSFFSCVLVNFDTVARLQNMSQTGTVLLLCHVRNAATTNYQSCD